MRHFLVVWQLVFCMAAGAQAAGFPDVLERVRPAVVGVGTAYPARTPLGGKPPNELRGTGFVIGDGLTVVTNHHVVPQQLDRERQQIIAVFSGRGERSRIHAARVLAQDEEHDLALLRLEGAPLPVLTLASGTSAVREGEDIAFTGFPIGAVLGLYPVTHRGIISAITPVARAVDNARHINPAQLRRLRQPYDVLQLDAIAYPGNSGSPVYRPDSGAVVGVINSVFVKESREAVLERPSGISYAIPVAHVHRLLERAPQ